MFSSQTSRRVSSRPHLPSSSSSSSSHHKTKRTFYYQCCIYVLIIAGISGVCGMIVLLFSISNNMNNNNNNNINNNNNNNINSINNNNIIKNVHDLLLANSLKSGGGGGGGGGVGYSDTASSSSSSSSSSSAAWGKSNVNPELKDFVKKNPITNDLLKTSSSIVRFRLYDNPNCDEGRNRIEEGERGEGEGEGEEGERKKKKKSKPFITIQLETNSKSNSFWSICNQERGQIREEGVPEEEENDDNDDDDDNNNVDEGEEGEEKEQEEEEEGGERKKRKRKKIQQIRSIKIIEHTNNAELDLYSSCNLNDDQAYFASVFMFDDCVRLWDWPNTQRIVAVEDSLVNVIQTQPKPIPSKEMPPLQPHVMDMVINKEIEYAKDVPTYRIIYSGESSEYMGYQAQANFYGFLTSAQHPNARFQRLLTGQSMDDLAEYIPTFQSKRHPYSKRYGPLNKADSIFKYFQSTVNAPTEEVIVVIDPDNWIIKDISNWVKQVSPGHAIGEAAWFHGSTSVTRLWKEVCLTNCDWPLDLVGVPYVIHREDLRKIAPWFRTYILLMKEKEEADPAFERKYGDIQMGWGTEMFGYIFAAAHVGIKHEVVWGIQVRDVGERPQSKEKEKSLSMIHMGRAWFPEDYEPGRKWWHTEGKAWSYLGAQVWCKCNWTASDIIPWPLPEKIDFQSKHTLYLLHHSREYFGEIPKNTKFRQTGPEGYHASMS